MAIVTINDKPVDIGNEKLNLIQAAKKAGIEIPHYCWHPSLSVVASCRMCLVEVGEMKDGKAVMQPRVVPACQTPAKDGTVMITNSEKASFRKSGRSKACFSIIRSIARCATRPASACCRTLRSSSAKPPAG